MLRRRVYPFVLRRAGSFCLAAFVLLGCAGAAPLEAERYPEKKRPEPLRSASDGEVMGANQQSPEDTLEGSATTGHAAPGGPGAESPEAEEAHQRLDHEECEAANAQPDPSAEVAGTPPKKKRLCPPAPPARSHD